MRRLLSVVVLCTSLVTNTLATPPHIPMAKAITRDDICMAWVINDEARGEPVRGQRAVYDVVKHRMEIRKLTACEVVKEPYQFSGYHRGMRLTATEEMLQRLSKVRRIAPVASNATYFHSNKVRPKWAHKMKRILTIGKHAFYMPRKQKEKHK